MSKGNSDPEFTHVQTASCYADADYGLKPTKMFFLQPLLPPNLWRDSGLVQTSCWSVSKKQAGAAASRHLQRALPWPRAWNPLMRVFACFSFPTSCDWWPLEDPRCSGYLTLLTVDSCFVEHNQDGTSLVSFSTFSHVSGKSAFSSAWEITFAHSALLDCGGHVVTYEVDIFLCFCLNKCNACLHY